MMYGDTINGLFELSGAVAGAHNIRILLRHKRTRGVSTLAYWYFFAWGVWNMAYYPSLHQWVSFSAAAVLALCNGLYAGLAIYFNRRAKWLN